MSTETRLVVVCNECQVHWYSNAVPAKCADPAHGHQELEVHRHLSTVVLPDGTEVNAASFDDADPYRRERPPDYGLYLDRAWQPPWAHAHLDWPDFGVPADVTGTVVGLTGALGRARAGQRVELGCLGGHGRTGTALACLSVLGGLPAAEAVAWVRANYCTDAVETSEQEAFVAGLATDRLRRGAVTTRSSPSTPRLASPPASPGA
ncbi:MAG: protein-tyrosine phosphatase family protein [Acidimicrobiales bacterium]